MTFLNLVRQIYAAKAELFRRGIQANTVLLNQNLGIVMPFPFDDGLTPCMICGLNAEVVTDLPVDYSFLVCRKETPPPSRADAIRRMTDAELATAMLRLAGIGDQLKFCPCKPECIERLDTDDIPDEWCHACMVAWLGAPGEDGL